MGQVERKSERVGEKTRILVCVLLGVRVTYLSLRSRYVTLVVSLTSFGHLLDGHFHF